MTGFLRRPGRGEVAAGRPAPIADAREAQEMAMDEELRRRALVGELLDRLPGEPARLSALPALDEESFDLLLDALGMAVATGTVGYSDDGTLRLTVLDMGSDLPPALVRVGDGGVLESPDLLVQVGAHVIDTDVEDRLRDARRALLARPLMLAGDPAFGTVRAHAERLRSEFARELGYELVVRAGHARLRKRSHELVTDRPARIPRSGHPDTWQPFTRRHYVLFALALAACERARAQTTIGLLAEEVRSLASEDGIEVDLDRLDDRRCLADVFLFLASLGVLVPIAGHAEGLGPLARGGRRDAL